jgi:hypothetical protein
MLSLYFSRKLRFSYYSYITDMLSMEVSHVIFLAVRDFALNCQQCSGRNNIKKQDLQSPDSVICIY